VVLPKRNAKDLRDLPENVRHEMEFLLADTIDDVFRFVISALMAEPEPAPAAAVSD
jgi:ATP-dependent Lon protease